MEEITTPEGDLLKHLGRTCTDYEHHIVQAYDEMRGCGNGPQYCHNCGKRLTEIITESRRRTLGEVERMTEQYFKGGHGGGNWRRLVEQFKSKLEELKKI